MGEPEEEPEKTVWGIDPDSSYHSDDIIETSDGFGTSIGPVSSASISGVTSLSSSVTYPPTTTLQDYVRPSTNILEGHVAADGTLVTSRDEETGDISAHIVGTDIVRGVGSDTIEAIEDLVESIRVFLDGIYGAHSDKPPTLTSEFLTEVQNLETWSKALGLLTT